MTITIAPGLAKLTIGPESTTPGTTGKPYSLQLTATVEGDKTWTVDSGTLPPGRVLDPARRAFSRDTHGGRPVRLPGARQDERRHAHRTPRRSRDRPCATSSAVLGTEPFTPARRATGEVSVPFDALLTATGGDGTYAWSLYERRAPTRTRHDGRRHLGDTHDLRPLSLHGNRHRHGRCVSPTIPHAILIGRSSPNSDEGFRPARRASSPTRRSSRPWAASCRAHGGSFAGRCPRGIRFDRSVGLLFGIPTRPGPLPREVRGNRRTRREGDEDARGRRPRKTEADEEADEEAGDRLSSGLGAASPPGQGIRFPGRRATSRKRVSGSGESAGTVRETPWPGAYRRDS